MKCILCLVHFPLHDRKQTHAETLICLDEKMFLKFVARMQSVFVWQWGHVHHNYHPNICVNAVNVSVCVCVWMHGKACMCSSSCCLCNSSTHQGGALLYWINKSLTSIATRRLWNTHRRLRLGPLNSPSFSSSPTLLLWYQIILQFNVVSLVL